MKQAIVYNLTDFAAKYQLNDIFGAYATHLHFSDQSALSNFFKLRSGMSPLAYRNQ